MICNRNTKFSRKISKYIVASQESIVEHRPTLMNLKKRNIPFLPILEINMVTNIIYPWKRYWCLREGSMNLSDGGYLSDPDATYGNIYNKDVVDFETISKKPCLVLLGEPGIGKTSSMQLEKISIERKIESEGNKILWLDLRSYGDEKRLVEKLFHNKLFQELQRSDYILHVFLDSLDECLLRIDTLASLLIEEFKEFPTGKLRLRIACRTKEWPNSLESSLHTLWGKNDVGVYELAFLRKKDVIEAANLNNIGSNMFLKEIDDKEVVPLAIKPITLNFLLNIFKKTGKFPKTKNELYIAGCELLCEEPNEGRRDVGRVSQFNPKQLLAVASRIAAVTTFSNKFAVWTSIDMGDVPLEDVTISELLGSHEKVITDEIKVDKKSIEEALKTGLFTSRGSNRMGWAHQTYAEFLAAHYIITHDVPFDKQKNLIFHSVDPQSKLIPQLYEVSSWLSTMSSDVFNEIVKKNPEVLLRSDLRASEEKYKDKLVIKLLDSFEKEEIYDVSGNISNNYEKLSYNGLSERLRPYIIDKNKNIYSRRASIKIAEACDIRNLQNDILSIVLETDQDYHLRTTSIFYIAQVGDSITKNRLKPLITSDNFDDKDDELKGYALDALWPNNITAEELFDVLGPPKRDNFFGAYNSFISFNLVKNLKICDLPVALRWVTKQAERHRLNHSIEKLVYSIMYKAWENLESNRIIEPFTHAVIARLKCYDDFNYHSISEKFSLRDKVIKDDSKRRKVIKKIIDILPDTKKVIQLASSHLNPFVLNKDVIWMIDQINISDSKEKQLILASLIEYNFDIHDFEQVNKILECCMQNIILAEQLKHFIEPIALGSPQAKALKERHEKYKSITDRDKNNPSLDPPPRVIIEKYLKECESGKIESWWLLNYEMTLKEDSRYYGDEREYDLTKLPGWEAADEKTKLRIITSAKEYVLKQDCKKGEWLGKNIFCRPAVAGYRALLLILKFEPEFINELTEKIWNQWAPIVLECFSDSDLEDEKLGNRLLFLAYKNSPKEIINTLNIIIDKENRENNHIWITTKIKELWDNKIEEALLVKLKSGTLKPEAFGILIGELLEHDVPEAREIALTIVTDYSTGMDDKAIVVTKQIMIHAKDSEWETIWPIIKKYPDFGRAVVEGYSHFNRNFQGILDLLSEVELSELFIWLVQQYPLNENNKEGRKRFVSPSDSASYLKDHVLSRLTTMGTYRACEEIRRIMQHFTEMRWLNYNLLEGLENARRKTWTPLTPMDLIKLINIPENQMIQNGDQLLDVLLDSLGKLEKEFQGETPSAIDLWNNVKGKYTPKDEGAFSNYIKRYLDKDIAERGIIVNREVEIRRGEGTGKGERTDIHINAITKKTINDSYDKITVIIEAKGCWHKELDTNMNDQLLERYLKDNQCNHGLYLIGWFNCVQWDDEDYRKSDSPKMSLSDFRLKFKKQADELSVNGDKIKSFVLNCSLR